MYFFWFLVFAGMPALLPFGIYGFFGKEAGKAAYDLVTGMTIILLLGGIITIAFLAIKAVIEAIVR